MMSVSKYSIVSKKVSKYLYYDVYTKLSLHTLAMKIKALFISLDELVEKGRRQNFQPVLHSLYCLLVTPQTLVGRTFLEVEKQVTVTWCKGGNIRRMLKKCHLKCSNIARLQAAAHFLAYF